MCSTGSAGGLAGNNAVEMQTTAEFDQGADEFIITTPTTLAQKYWVCYLHLFPGMLSVSPCLAISTTMAHSHAVACSLLAIVLLGFTSQYIEHCAASI